MTRQKDGLTEQSSRSEVVAKPGTKATLSFGGLRATTLPLSSVCVDGEMLAIVERRIDTGR